MIRRGPVEWLPPADDAPHHASSWTLARQLACCFRMGVPGAARIFGALSLPDALDVLYVAAEGAQRLGISPDDAARPCGCPRECDATMARRLVAEPRQVGVLARERIGMADVTHVLGYVLRGLAETAATVAGEDEAGPWLALSTRLDHAAVFGT